VVCDIAATEGRENASHNFKMKRPNRKSEPRTQSEPKPAEVKLIDQHLESLELERLQASRRPTVFELSQIAAALIPGNGWKDHFVLNKGREYDHPKAINAEDCAMDVWERCRKEIIARIDASIMMRRVRAFRGPEWQQALKKETFPMPFEHALAIIVGKTRKLERNKAFRDFIRFDLPTPKKDEDELSIISRVEEKFKKLLTEGFSRWQLEDSKIKFDSWIATRAHFRAKNAAVTRWAKANTKK
jgi:hypothetical protein